jgi:16S rRNA (cytidine1402-2'-O)-methyltransferase
MEPVNQKSKSNNISLQNMKGKGRLFLIPNTLGDTDLGKILPAYNREIISSLIFFIVEEIRTTRRFLKKVNPKIDINQINFSVLNEHTDFNEISSFLEPLTEGFDMGIISEAGCPAIADPGADVVALAQQQDIQVIPLIGPSSILLSLMASGFNGQNFAFLGYLPVKQEERINVLKKIENRIYSENQTQIFIETPYRNMKMLEDILNTCKSTTKLCIASDLTLETEYIKTKTISEWKLNKLDLNKKPCIFLLYQ